MRWHGVGSDRREAVLWDFSGPICVEFTVIQVVITAFLASVLPRSRNCLWAEEGGQASPPDLGGPGRRGK
jgi:hypothetical protein